MPVCSHHVHAQKVTSTNDIRVCPRHPVFDLYQCRCSRWGKSSQVQSSRQYPTFTLPRPRNREDIVGYLRPRHIRQPSDTIISFPNFITSTLRSHGQSLRRLQHNFSPFSDSRALDGGSGGHARVGELVNLLLHSSLIYGLDNILKSVVGRSVIGRRGRDFAFGTLVTEDDLF